MSRNLRIYTRAMYGFDHVAKLITEWDAPSPCAGWTARHVIGHVTGIQQVQRATIVGTPLAINPMVDPHLIAGEDPFGTWATARDAILETLDHEGVLGRTVSTWRGERTVDEMIGFNVGDITIHTWDLARAEGVDDRLDAQVCRMLYDRLAPMADGMRNPMVFGPAVDPVGDDPQSLLLALVGRSVAPSS